MGRIGWLYLTSDHNRNGKEMKRKSASGVEQKPANQTKYEKKPN